MRKISSWFILGVLIVVAGCQTNFETTEPPLEILPNPGGSPPSTPQPVSPTQGETMIPPTPGTSGMEVLIEMAKKDLAQRLSISITDIVIVETSEAEWSDSSLDCPQPGMNYLQVITPGFRIVLEASGNLYEYHSNRDTYVVYCESSFPRVPSPKP